MGETRNRDATVGSEKELEQQDILYLRGWLLDEEQMWEYAVQGKLRETITRDTGETQQDDIIKQQNKWAVGINWF